MQRARSFFTDLIKTCDVFTSPVCLRYDKEPDYDTCTGGCFSIAMIIILVSVFFNQWIDILNYAVIYANEETVRQFDPSKLMTNTDQFMFALGVIGINLNSNATRYFNLQMTASWRDENKTNHITNIPLIPCTVDQWSKFGPQFAQTFTRMNLQTFKCPPSNYSLHFEGKFTSENFAYIKIAFSRCTGVDCKTNAQFNSYIASNTAFFLNIFYKNTLLNKDQLKPIQPLFQDKLYVMTSHQLGINMNIYVSQFQMTTDQTLWPWTNEQVTKGLIVDKNDYQQWSFIPTGSSMSKIYFRKSDNKIYINRSFRKLDDMLSYIGGLFGIIAVLFGVIMTYYSQCSYELALSSNIFEYKIDEDQNQSSNKGDNDDNNGGDTNNCQGDQIRQNSQISEYQNSSSPSFTKKMKEHAKKSKKKKNQQQKQLDPSDFNFWDYLRYLVFLVLKHIGCKPKWKKMIMYDDTIDEMRNQMNINTLLQKITFFDKAIQTLFDQEQLKLLYLQEKYNIIDIKKEREMLDLGMDILNKFMVNFDAPNGQNGQNVINETNINEQQQRSNWKMELATQNNLFNKVSLKSLHKLSQNPFDALINVLSKGSKNQDGIPEQIVSALDKLQIKISLGDIISKRIYQGLDPLLIQKYQNKNNRNSSINKRKHKIKFEKEKNKQQRISIMCNHKRQSSFMGLLSLKKQTSNVANSYQIQKSNNY